MNLLGKTKIKKKKKNIERENLAFVQLTPSHWNYAPSFSSPVQLLLAGIDSNSLRRQTVWYPTKPATAISPDRTPLSSLFARFSASSRARRAANFLSEPSPPTWISMHADRLTRCRISLAPSRKARPPRLPEAPAPFSFQIRSSRRFASAPGNSIRNPFFVDHRMETLSGPIDGSRGHPSVRTAPCF